MRPDAIGTPKQAVNVKNSSIAIELLNSTTTFAP
jgi:hypothetical protein